MSDSAFIQEWPEDKLTVAQLRAVVESLSGESLELGAEEQLDLAKDKLRGALIRAEEAQPSRKAEASHNRRNRLEISCNPECSGRVWRTYFLLRIGKITCGDDGEESPVQVHESQGENHTYVIEPGALAHKDGK